MLKSEIIHENPWWKYVHDKYQLSDGEQGDYYYCQTNGSAMIIPVLGDGRLVLVRQYRYLRQKNSVEFPCGAILPTEKSVFKAAGRELLEETGYEYGDLIKIGEFEPVNGYCNDNTHIYVATDLRQISSPIILNNEATEVMFRRVDEFNDMIKNGEIWDGQTLASWAMAKDYVSNLVNE